MRTFRMKWRGRAGESVIVCRKGVLEKELSPDGLLARGALVLTDSNVFALYREQLGRIFPSVPVHVTPAGEAHKDEAALFSLLGAMAEAGLRRDSALVAFGGGVVGDLGGLAASLYMRGIDCIQVPTTLLAQVDSAVGGKTAIDFCGVKNLVGAFHQPSQVLVDPIFLNTLSVRELRCGLGEIVKHAALSGEIFDRIRERELFDLDLLAKLVPENIAFKLSVVKRDPFEKGLRKCLNLGHTTGHAFELANGALSHGECVLFGMLYEGRIARRRIPSCDAGYLAELEALVRRALGPRPVKFDIAAAANAARLDKKNVAAGSISLILPVRKGEWTGLDLSHEEYLRELFRSEEELC